MLPAWVAVVKSGTGVVLTTRTSEAAFSRVGRASLAKMQT